MNGVSERIENCRNFQWDRCMMPPDVSHREGNILGKCSRPVHADSLCMRAEMPPSRQAVPAAAADHMSLAAHDHARMKVVNIRSRFYDLADEFVPDHQRCRDRALCPLVPLVDVQVGAADAC